MQVIGVIFIFIIGFWVIGRIIKLVKKVMDCYIEEEFVCDFLGLLVGIGLKVFLLFSVVFMFGIEVIFFVVIFSVMVFVIGFVFQGNFVNFVSGVFILVFKFFKVGDFVEVNGYVGIVIDIFIFYIVFVVLDNWFIIVFNG